MDIVIRPAESDDYAAIAELSVLAYADDGQLAEGVGGHYAARLRDVAGRAKDASLLVAVDADGTVLGSVAICLPGSPLAEINRPGELEFRMLAVHPDAQGRGVGRALATACVDRARELGSRAVVICTRDEVGKPAQAMYRSMGFTRIPDRDWNPIANVQLLAWELAL